MKNIYEQVDENKLRSGVVIAGFIAFIMAASYFITYAMGFDSSFIGIALIISGILSFVSFYYSDSIILSISGATPASKRDHFDFYTVTENLVGVARIPMPKLFVIEDTAMNAFATGRDPEHAVVCATTGILARLNRTELEGVVAHELSHVKNYDIRLMGIVTILVGLVTLLADILLRTRIRGRGRDDEGNLGAVLFVAGIVMALLSPIIAQLIQLAVSRRREFLADASGAALTKFPEGLASALEKISADKEPLEAANKATAHLYIANPLKNHHDSIGWFAGLFNTHPPVKERLKALRGE
ncbi:zinc metalloprotease HtpX [Candidatus Collierbacteria bacterium CG1_02_44_10]|uniref:Protease HtpX homolog n=4 Tax=Candidatus Collieribacteriota TaxID=1752725 RepID=A0A2H0DTB7_9BACT|nr:M48 family metallopeptidase [bacterium]OIN91091.1 MAG: zinc metalloprotease HtpX [Candidatus Collierbacteria bacterium CG1_02_44_10]PIP85427.1 MAG: zinc metalloprotease HtpX [Candidatus Collierbacteria bacterium CG22_combo_CG10-13_8_21_14_all_43_12]PIR99639.1 MAG: zinc metalloprotease HtpX [Candidatus Collierbacteria bacterium CG10_big_fil_rev_8_21_14_0_10_43_36]PIZ24073.1 MAG: zinc metalloprotease HtpX [Candidatus Collierbacteria bacterium CG_4_10_14_0_8_um_filter_43_86]PJB47345.1 MAG: zin